MDPITALGVTSGLITLVQFGFEVGKRLEELSRAGGIPKSFKEVQTRTRLIASILKTTQDAHIDLDPDFRAELKSLIDDCHAQITELDDIISKVKVTGRDSRWRRGLKVTVGMVEEGRVQRIALALRDNIEVLTALNAARRHERGTWATAGRRESEVAPLASPLAHTATPHHFMVPFVRDKQFIGREKTLADIGQNFAVQKRVSIVGMGGVGKSQVAIEFAHRLREERSGKHIFWVYGGSVSRFYQGYKRIAEKLQLPSRDDPDVSILELVATWMNETKEEFLLIVDNADNINEWWPEKYSSERGDEEPVVNLSQYLPDNYGRGNLLVTSRDTRVAGRLIKEGAPILIEPLSKVEAIRLFFSYAPQKQVSESRHAVEGIVEALDCLPLAITQAASFTVENDIRPEDYLEALGNNAADEYLDEELSDARRDEQSVNSAFKAWKLSFDQIIKQKPQAAELLFLLAVFERQSIPRWLIKGSQLVVSLGVLQAFNMIRARAGSQTFQLHRLTQRFVQMSLRRAGKLEYWQGVALARIANAYPTEIGVQEWTTCATLAPHVHVITSYQYTSMESRLDLARLLCWAADYDIERGLLSQALHRAKRSYDLFTRLVPPEDQQLASATWLYGRLLFYESRSEQETEAAAALLREALRIADKQSLTYGETAFELAYVYYSQGKEEECLHMAKESFECWTRIGGASSVRTLDNMHDYALQLAMFGHTGQGIANWREILKRIPESDAMEDTRYIFSYRSTACTAEFEGDFSLAEDFYSHLIRHCTAIYGPDHVHVFDYRLSRAEAILRQGRYGEALDTTQSILQSCHRKSEWRIADGCWQIIAESWRFMENYAEEEAARRKCIELDEQHLGANHEDVMTATEALARCLIRRAKFEDAEILLKQILRWRQSRQGTQNADKLITMELLAVCKMLQGRDHEGEEILTQTLELGGSANKHLYDNLCTALWNQCKWAELETRCREALALESGQDLSRFHWMLIASLETKGKFEEALARRVESLELEGGEMDADLDIRLQPEEPPFMTAEQPRFGRIIHPRTWSS